MAKMMQSLTVETIGIFGECNRYRAERWISARPLLIELGAAVTFAVVDAELVDEETGLASVIRQASTLEEALAGLCDPRDRARLAAAAA